MNKDELLTKKSEAEKRFNDLTQQKREIEIELYRLQGDFRTYESLLESLDEPKEAEKVDKKVKSDGK